MAITLSELRTQTRNRADMSQSEFVTDSELNFYINQSIRELHDILTDAYQSDYYMSTNTFNTVSGTDSYALPSDFYELRGVDVKLNSNEWYTLKKFNFNERVRYKQSGSWNYSNAPYLRYRLNGNNIMFNPTPDSSNQTIRIWYTPVATELVNDGDSFADFNGFSEYVIVDAAIKCLQKEESDVSVLMAQKGALLDRIRNKAQQRDANESDSVQDVYAENDDIYWRNRS